MKKIIIMFILCIVLIFPNYSYAESYAITAEGLNWIKQQPLTSPPPSIQGAMAYDPVANKIVLFGLFYKSVDIWENNTWVWDEKTWIRLDPQISPPARQDPGMVYDPISKSIILFGGVGLATGLLNDTWSWNGSEWKQIATVGPSPRGHVMMTYDPMRQQIVLFGGVQGDTQLSDTWTWDGKSWKEQHPAVTPPGRFGHTMVYDPISKQVVMFSGFNKQLGLLNDTWTWDGVNWTQQHPQNIPLARYFARMQLHTAFNHPILFGGFSDASNYDSALNDTWTWKGNDWEKLNLVNSPPGNAFFEMAYHEHLNSMVLFGGWNGKTNLYNLTDTWTLPLKDIPINDTIAPTSTANLLSNPNQSGWFNGDVTVSLTAIDNQGGSGVRDVHYSLNDANPIIENGNTVSVKVSNEGVNTITYFATDNVGNIETGKKITVNIDKTAPVTKISLNPVSPNGANGWYKNVTVTMFATDTLSGVAKTEYSINGGTSWLTYSSPITFTQDGIYSINFRSMDNAGNVEIAQNLSFNLDATVPIIAIAEPTESLYKDSLDLKPQFSVSDGWSGIDAPKTTVTLDGQNVQQGVTIPLYTLPLGSHKYSVMANDMAGNSQNVSVTFQTYADLESLKTLTTSFSVNKWIDNSGIAKNLQSKLRQGDLGSFIHELQAQSTKHITKEASTYLLRDARWVIDSLKTKVNRLTNNKSMSSVVEDLLESLNEGDLKDFALKVQKESGKHISPEVANSLLLGLQSLLKDDQKDNDKKESDK